MTRPPRFIIPRGGPAVSHQPPLAPAPGPPLGHRERPQADVERPHAGPHEPYLLLPRAHDLLAIPERGLQGEPIGHAPEDVGHARRRVGTEVRHPPGRLVHDHYPDRAPGRPPRRHERLVPLRRLLPVQGKRADLPPAPLPGPLGQLHLALPPHPGPPPPPATA